jgi:hypothetical protein
MPTTPKQSSALASPLAKPTVSIQVFPFEFKIRETLVSSAAVADNPKANTYGLRYGFRQSLQDVQAGVIAGITGVGLRNPKDAWSVEERTTAATTIGYPGEIHTDAGRKALAEDYANYLVAERWQAILDGKVAIRTVGPRLRGLDWFIRDEAVSALRESAKAKGRKMPSGEKLDALVSARVAKDPSITERAKARFATSQKDAEYQEDEDESALWESEDTEEGEAA